MLRQLVQHVTGTAQLSTAVSRSQRREDVFPLCGDHSVRVSNEAVMFFMLMSTAETIRIHVGRHQTHASYAREMACSAVAWDVLPTPACGTVLPTPRAAALVRRVLTPPKFPMELLCPF